MNTQNPRFCPPSVAPLIVAALLLTPFCAARAADTTKPAKRPNVIFILTDDQGWADARFAGHPYVKTPNLDRFASQGTWFKQFYVAATVCSPSRAAFMTSHYPARHHMHGHLAEHPQNQARSMPDWLDPKVPTITRLLSESGYATAHFGKWHLGSGPGAPPPTDYGFDVAKVVNGNGPALGDEGKDPFFRAKSTAMIVDETIAFMRAHRDSPFYINVWTLLPHALLKPTPEQLAVYADLQPKADDPAFGPWMRKYLANASALRSQMQVYCASLTDLDTQLGRLFAALDELKLADNTIVFFSSDNGAEDYRIGNAKNAGVGNTGPLRARKRSIYEGGIRTFGLLRWPGHVAAGRVDETSVIGGVDFLPTICRLTGVGVPGDVKRDGEDVSDIWLGTSRPRTKALHWEWLFNVQGVADGYLPPMLAIRDGDWKLFVSHKGTGAQLFNIPKDAGEEHDVASSNPEIVKSLTDKALAWVKTLPPSPARDTAAATGRPQDTSAAREDKAKAKRKAKGEPAANGDATGKKDGRPAASDRHAVFKRWDANHDGKLSLEEFKKRLKTSDAEERFKRFDTNHDGELTEEEFVKAGKP